MGVFLRGNPYAMNRNIFLIWESSSLFFLCVCFIDNFLSFHHSSLSVKWPHHQNNKDKRHYWVSFYIIIKVSRGRDDVVLFSSYSFWSDESLCRIRMVEEKKVTVGWRPCVTHRDDIHLRGPIGKKEESRQDICWTCTGFCMCIVHLCVCVCVCVSTCVVLCAIRSTVKQEVSTGQDRKKERNEGRPWAVWVFQQLCTVASSLFIFHLSQSLAVPATATTKTKSKKKKN